MKQSPQELFTEQKEAFLKGDMATVKMMGEHAKEKLPPKGDWEEAKKEFDKLEFPDDSDGWRVGSGTHATKKRKHTVQRSWKQLPDLMGHEVWASYTYCPECQEMRTKYLIMFNSPKNVAYERWFLINGRKPGQKDVSELVGQFFAALLPFFLA